MSFLGAVADMAASAIENYGAQYARSMLPSILRSGIDAGYTGAEMLRQLRSVGAGISTQRFYQALGQIQASEISAEGVSGLSLESTPDETMFADWGVTNPRGYVYQFRMYVGEQLENGQLIPSGYRNFSLRTNQIQNVGEILQDAIDLFKGMVGRYVQVFLGAELANLYKEVGLR